jgi:AcrR family transcriptional regulator
MARATYHHGNLRDALVDEAARLIAARGPQGFSVAEAARAAGVSGGAPYRHFADREALVAAVAERGYAALGAALDAAVAGARSPRGALAAIAAAYVRFFAADPPAYTLLFASGLDKTAHPAVAARAAEVLGLLLAPARALTGEDEAARRLAIAVGVVAHGYTTTLLDGHLGDGDAAARDAAAAVRALLRGRAELLRAD